MERIQKQSGFRFHGCAVTAATIATGAVAIGEYLLNANQSNPPSILTYFRKQEMMRMRQRIDFNGESNFFFLSFFDGFPFVG